MKRLGSSWANWVRNYSLGINNNFHLPSTGLKDPSYYASLKKCCNEAHSHGRGELGRLISKPRPPQDQSTNQISQIDTDTSFLWTLQTKSNNKNFNILHPSSILLPCTPTYTYPHSWIVIVLYPHASCMPAWKNVFELPKSKSWICPLLWCLQSELILHLLPIDTIKLPSEMHKRVLISSTRLYKMWINKRLPKLATIDWAKLNQDLTKNQIYTISLRI